MFSKGSKLYSIFKFKCPHCHEGEFFINRNPYYLSTIGDLLEKCPVCNRKYEPEPGFYYGAMYVSYALGVGLFVIAYVVTYLIVPDASIWVHISVVVGSLFLFGPYLYALSKSMWASMFFNYKGVQLTEKERIYLDERGKGRLPSE